jgi:hypothetical protein
MCNPMIISDSPNGQQKKLAMIALMKNIATIGGLIYLTTINKACVENVKKVDEKKANDATRASQ